MSQADTTPEPNPDGYRRNNRLQVPKWPSYNNLKSWVFKIARKCFSLSRYSDQCEIAWVMEVWDKSYEELADTGEQRFSWMDMQISQESDKIISKKLQVD